VSEWLLVSEHRPHPIVGQPPAKQPWWTSDEFRTGLDHHADRTIAVDLQGPLTAIFLTATPTARIVVASCVIVARIVLALVRQRRSARVVVAPDSPPAESWPDRVLSAVIAVAQVAGAALTVLEWLHRVGLV
jgi:hypothetical protein